MNEIERYKKAKELEAKGIDPDHVMLCSLEEYCAMYGEKIDTFDEDQLKITALKFAIKELLEESTAIEAEIAQNYELIKANDNNWSAKHDLQNDINDLNRQNLKLNQKIQYLQNQILSIKEKLNNDIPFMKK